MQLFSEGIGPDRVSDITGNILKSFLIEYTQQQCELWQLPMVAGVPIAHAYDADRCEWRDGYFDLPVNPVDGAPILLVPRRIVRALPWINYEDFVRSELRAYLAAQRGKNRSRVSVESAENLESKRVAVNATRGEVGLVDRYVRSKELSAASAKPSGEYLDGDVCREAERLAESLRQVQAGREAAADYQRLILEILNFLFNPDLANGRLEVRTIDGTERRDIVFINESEEPFWDYVRNEHSSLLLMFETKNVADLEMTAVNQTATYIGSRLGRLGVIVTRRLPSESVQRKAISVWNDSGVERKVILILTDEHVLELLTRRCKDMSTTKWFQNHYREFRQSAQ